MVDNEKPDKTVTIRVQDEALTIKPSVLRLTRGVDKIINFVAPDSTMLTIQFKGLSPFNKAYFSNPDPDTIQLRSEAEPGSYPYAVAVDHNGRIYLDAATPVIEYDW